MEASQTPGRFTAEVQEDMLVTLRYSYKVARKMFMFSLINAKSGLADAPLVIKTKEVEEAAIQESSADQELWR